jgi:hypothetical protein
VLISTANHAMQWILQKNIRWLEDYKNITHVENFKGTKTTMAQERRKTFTAYWKLLFNKANVLLESFLRSVLVQRPVLQNYI